MEDRCLLNKHFPFAEVSHKDSFSVTAGQPLDISGILVYQGDDESNSLLLRGPSYVPIIDWGDTALGAVVDPVKPLQKSSGWTLMDNSAFPTYVHDGPGQWSLTGSHTYKLPGTYTIKGFVTELGGHSPSNDGSVSFTATVVVKPIPMPSISLSFSDPDPVMGETFSLLATVTNPGDTDGIFDVAYNYTLRPRDVLPGDAVGSGTTTVSVPAHQSRTIELHKYNYSWQWIPNRDWFGSIIKDVKAGVSTFGNPMDPTFAGNFLPGLIARLGELGTRTAGLMQLATNAIGPLFDAADAVSLAVLDQGLHAEATVARHGATPNANAQASTEVDVPFGKKADLAGFVAADFGASILFPNAIASFFSGNIPAGIASMQEAVVLMMTAETFYGQALDPPDADYKNLPTATFADGSAPNTNPSTAGAPELARLLMTAALEQGAAAIAINRSQGAAAAGDAVWQAKQLAAAAEFDAKAAATFARLVSLAPAASPARTTLPDTSTGPLADSGTTPEQIDDLRRALLAAGSPTTDGRNPLSAAFQSLVAADIDLSNDSLAQSVVVRLGPTGSPTPLSEADRAFLDGERTSIGAALEAGDPQGALLPRVVDFEARVRSLVLTTNNLAALQGDLDAASSFLAADVALVVAAQPSTVIPSPAVDPPPTTTGPAPSTSPEMPSPSTSPELPSNTPPTVIVDPSADPSHTPVPAVEPMPMIDPSPTVDPDISTPVMPISVIPPEFFFVQTLYVEMLGRGPTPGESSTWISRLDAGLSPTKMARQIWQSGERRAFARQHPRGPRPRFQVALADAIRASGFGTTSPLSSHSRRV